MSISSKYTVSKILSKETGKKESHTSCTPQHCVVIVQIRVLLAITL